MELKRGGKRHHHVDSVFWVVVMGVGVGAVC